MLRRLRARVCSNSGRVNGVVDVVKVVDVDVNFVIAVVTLTNALLAVVLVEAEAVLVRVGVCDLEVLNGAAVLGRLLVVPAVDNLRQR